MTRELKVTKPLAFVLSGGGARGALQVGALQVLLERGLKPDLLVGASAGALNAAFLASDPTIVGLQRLAVVWRQVVKDDVYPGSRLFVLWRLLRSCESLYPNDRFQRFVRHHLRAAHLKVFGDIPNRLRLYILATDLSTTDAYVFGDRPDDLLLDAVMASSALPPLHPPWRINGAAYIDGAFASELPVHVAAERGAREIYALHITDANCSAQSLNGVVEITVRALGAFTRQQLEHELQVSDQWPTLRLHYVPLTAFSDWPVWDFRRSAEMIKEGRAAMLAYLDAPTRSQDVSDGRWLDFLKNRWQRIWPAASQHKASPPPQVAG